MSEETSLEKLRLFQRMIDTLSRENELAVDHLMKNPEAEIGKEFPELKKLYDLLRGTEIVYNVFYDLSGKQVQRLKEAVALEEKVEDNKEDDEINYNMF